MIQPVVTSDFKRGQAILPDNWRELKPHKIQSQVWESRARFINLRCGRRSGKTELAYRKVIGSLYEKKPWTDPRYFYAMPTREHAKKKAWRDFERMIPEHIIEEKNVMELYIKTIFGSELFVVGLDKPQRVEAFGYDGGVIDESSDIKPGVWARSIRPALADRKGWCWRIGVTKRYGVGSIEFNETFRNGLDPVLSKKLDTQSFTWPSLGIVDPDEVEAARNELTLEDFQEQFEALEVDAGGSVYSHFSKTHNVIECEETNYNPFLDIVIGMDFNVDPMCWVIGHIIQNPHFNGGLRSLCIFDEVFIRNINTIDCLQTVFNKYREHKKVWNFYGDAASRQRRTSGPSAALSDYIQIANFGEIPKTRKNVLIPNSNPNVADRLCAVNGMIYNAKQKRRLFINPRCKRLITDFENLSFKEGTSIIDESNDDAKHITDAIGYLIWQEFPLRLEGIPAPKVAIQQFA